MAKSMSKLHAEAQERHDKRNLDKLRNPNNFFQSEFDINVEESYEKSSELIQEEDNPDYEMQIAHLESVLGAGPLKYG